MPVIELNLSDEVYLRWRDFMGSQQADRLVEAGLLGDWVALGFMNKINDYLKQGGPPGVETEDERRQRMEAEARRKLTKPQKRVLPMFDENETITLPEICRVLGIPLDQGRTLVQDWVAQDFLSNAPVPATTPPPLCSAVPGRSATWRPIGPPCTRRAACISRPSPSRAPTKASSRRPDPGNICSRPGDGWAPP